MRKRGLFVLLGLVLFVAGAAAAAVVVWKERNPGSIRGSGSTEFVSTEEPGATTRPEEVVRQVPWPTYGYDDARTRFVPDFDLRPPYRQIWSKSVGSLLEFPPVVAYGRLYVGTNNGRFFALDKRTGKPDWEKDFGLCTAASATVADDVVYQPFMDPHPSREHKQDAPGYLVAMDADTGEELWRFRAGVIESSPLLVDGVLYFGSWDTKMYAVDAKTKKILWTVATGDKVKGGAAYAGGTVFFGSYDDKVYAVDAKSGKVRWSASGTANFYATPSVAYGRVYVGNTDGRVYAFGAKSGNLLWATATGSYVYSSAGIWKRKVYAGSYDGSFYAFDAGTGDVSWEFDAGGPISGAPTVLGGAVYFSTLEEETFALDAETGKKIWSFKDGKYSPVVADEDRLYVVGYKHIYAFEPKG